MKVIYCDICKKEIPEFNLWHLELKPVDNILQGTWEETYSKHDKDLCLTCAGVVSEAIKELRKEALKC